MSNVGPWNNLVSFTPVVWASCLVLALQSLRTWPVKCWRYLIYKITCSELALLYAISRPSQPILPYMHAKKRNPISPPPRPLPGGAFPCCASPLLQWIHWPSGALLLIFLAGQSLRTSNRKRWGSTLHGQKHLRTCPQSAIKSSIRIMFWETPGLLLQNLSEDQDDKLTPKGSLTTARLPQHHLMCPRGQSKRPSLAPNEPRPHLRILSRFRAFPHKPFVPFHSWDVSLLFLLGFGLFRWLWGYHVHQGVAKCKIAKNK